LFRRKFSASHPRVDWTISISSEGVLMAAKYAPKTLAKTLSYIACRAPGEYGLFWDPNGSMPWKELYWALQEDPSLRFVRESHIRELEYLGIELPFFLDGALLRLRDGSPVPEYSAAAPPERLYHAFPLKRYHHVSEHGLSPSSNRSFLPLSIDKEMALRIGRRRDPKPLPAEIQARTANLEGVLIRMVDSNLYLVESLPPEYVKLPPVREEELSRVAARKKERQSASPEIPVTPGSFFLDSRRFPGGNPDESAVQQGKGKGAKKGKRGRDWKRDARDQRHKREA
jgi:putative RNA 2'-phosphotransferase